MNKYLNSTVAANKVEMLRSHHRGAILIVEGDSDCHFFSTFVDPKACKIYPARGKDIVIKAVDLLVARKMPGILGIVDADYWHVAGVAPPEKNIIVTETHDLECLILLSDALERLVQEHIPGNRMDTVSGITQDLRKELLKLGTSIGYFRWASYSEGYCLKFEGIDYAKFIDHRGELSVDRLLQEVRRCTDNCDLPDDVQILHVVERLKLVDCDPWQICQGHELTALMKYVLPRILSKKFDGEVGARAARRLHPGQLERELRLSYHAEHFRVTKMWKEICNWEMSNRPYTVLKSLFTQAASRNEV